jgi:Methylamine utilisation protein MauE
VNKALLSQVAALVLAGLFAWAGLVKLRAPDRWRTDLLVYRLGRPLRAAGWLILPWLEVAVPGAVLVGRPRMAALLATGLVGVFSVAIVRARILVGSDQLACGCFGGHATRDYRVLLFRNFLLAVLAVFVLALAAPPIPVVSGPAAGLLLGAVGLVAIIWMVRQLLLRRDRREGQGRVTTSGSSAPGSGASVSAGQGAEG